MKILQAALVYVNTLMVQDVVADDNWSRSLTPEDRRGLEPTEAPDRSDIVSRIPGVYKGWRGTGDTITLENGQRWRIVQTSGALVVNVTDPTAIVSPAAFGTWSLRIEGYNARAKVKRVD